MSTATLERNTPSVDLGPGADTAGFGVPETATGFKNRIIAEVPGINHNFAKRVAYRLKRRADAMQEVFDFEVELRNLGITSDPTPRDAEHNLTCTKTECDKCGRTRRTY